MPGFLNKRVNRISVKPVAVILGWNSHINFPSESFLLAHISSHVTNMNQSNLGFKKKHTVTDFALWLFKIVLPFILLINFISEEICLIKEADFFFFL